MRISEKWDPVKWEEEKGHKYIIEITGEEKGLLEDGLQNIINDIEEYLQKPYITEDKAKKNMIRLLRIQKDNAKKLQRELYSLEKLIK